jgi:predicted O-methyltransferase YrrM
MHFISEDLEDYVANHSQAEPELLAKLNKETYQKIMQPRMLSGHFQGRVLSMLSKIIRPKHILEIGTYTGYAALCLAEGLAENGTLDTIDIEEELVDFQRKYFDASPWKDQIFQHLGDAVDIIPTLNKKFDLVFIDADKENYIHYYEMILPKTRIGGWILIDNVLWSGKVVEPIVGNDKETKTLVELNRMVTEDPRVENILLAIRDGVMMLQRVS